MAVVAMLVLATVLPAFAAGSVTLLECNQGGGHASGKYCSGGIFDGFLIVG